MTKDLITKLENIKFERPPVIPFEALAFMDIKSDDAKLVVNIYTKLIEATREYFKWKDGI